MKQVTINCETGEETIEDAPFAPITETDAEYAEALSDNLRAAWDAQTLETRVALRPAKALVFDALADGATDEARLILSNQAVPAQCERAKQLLLQLLPA